VDNSRAQNAAGAALVEGETMRTDPPAAVLAPLVRLRNGAIRAWRHIAGAGLATRLALIAGLVGLIVVVGFYASQDEPGGMAAIYEDHRFTPSEVARIGKALDAEEIAWTSDRGCIQVRRGRLAQVHALLERRGLGPLGLRDEWGEPVASSPLELLSDRDARERRHRERVLEAAIEEYDSTLQANVKIEPSRAKSSRNPQTPKVTVLLKAESDRRLRPAAVEGIATLLLSLVPDLKPEGLWILDSKLRVYHSPTSMSLRPDSMARSREEELTGRILEQLDYIKGVHVAVSIGVSARTVRAVPPASPQVVPNRPIEEPPVQAVPVTVLAAKAKVFVQVPAAYVLDRYRAVSQNPRPSPKELDLLFRETRERIETVVRNVVPTEDLGSVDVSRIEIAGAPLEAARVPEPTGPRLHLVGLATASGVGVLVLAVAVVWGLRLAGRRAPTRALPATRRPRLSSAGTTPPSERVRELVKLDPAAAAGVLQRWIGHGGHLP
jgi:hypothetical protein